ncbi:hypothetical protein HRG_013654 [Hirsutella rhossiliensis]
MVRGGGLKNAQRRRPITARGGEFTLSASTEKYSQPEELHGVRLRLQGVRWLKSPAEKATALRQATLERRTANDDIPDPWISVNTDRTIPFTDRVSPERPATPRYAPGIRPWFRQYYGLATIRSPSEKQKWS